MTKPTLSTLAMIGCWLAVAMLILVLWRGMVDAPRPGQFTLPLLFWTGYGLLLVVATSAAVGLPAEKAAFWRTFVLAMFIISTLDTGWFYFLTSSLATWLESETFAKWLNELRKDRWKHHVTRAVVVVVFAMALGGVAWLLRRIRPPRVDQTFRFGILHLLILSTVIACTCALLQRANEDTAFYLALAIPLLHLLFAVAAGAGWGHPKFVWGFLLGVWIWGLMDQRQLAEEWLAIVPAFLREHRENWPARYHGPLMQVLLPQYAGLVTGILAGLLHRPPPEAAVPSGSKEAA